MSKWQEHANTVDFAFEAELHMAFNEEGVARKISDLLREDAEIWTNVVKIG